jgi:hypothetical protein|tara:strand:+ start:104 stop:373 length:270 start_codon:yes stop_codon:yes gene_type:complete
MAFKRWQKSPSRKAPERNWEQQEMKIIGWCLTRNIGVGISPDWKDDLNRWKITIDINGKYYDDPNLYDNEEVYNKVIEYYKYYYDKYNK